MPLGQGSLTECRRDPAASDLETTTDASLLLPGALALAVALCASHLLRVRRARRGIRERHRRQWARRQRAAGLRHDGLVQTLLGVMMQIHAAAARLPRDDTVRGNLERALAEADRMLAPERVDADESAEVSGEALGEPLSGPFSGPLGGAFGGPFGGAFGGPVAELPSEDDLCVALTDAARQLRGAGEGAARVEVVAVGRQRTMTAQALFTAYRIAREALLDALRHAQASEVTVAVVYGRAELSVRVKDNGKGCFPSPDVSDGPGRPDAPSAPRAPVMPGTSGAAVPRDAFARMQGLAQRLAGSLSVLSVLGGGTAVEFRLGARFAYES